MQISDDPDYDLKIKVISIEIYGWLHIDTAKYEIETPELVLRFKF